MKKFWTWAIVQAAALALVAYGCLLGQWMTIPLWTLFFAFHTCQLATFPAQ